MYHYCDECDPAFVYGRLPPAAVSSQEMLPSAQTDSVNATDAPLIPPPPTRSIYPLLPIPGSPSYYLAKAGAPAPMPQADEAQQVLDDLNDFLAEHNAERPYVLRHAHQKE